MAHHTIKSPRPVRKLPEPKQLLGAAIALVLGGLWLTYTLRGQTPPPLLGQGLVAAFGLIGVGSIK